MKRPVQNSDPERLRRVGWIEEPAKAPWSWREPKTRALYRLQDAIDLINVRRSRPKGEKE